MYFVFKEFLWVWERISEVLGEKLQGPGFSLYNLQLNGGGLLSLVLHTPHINSLSILHRTTFQICDR